MSERYGKLFSLPENLYTEGSPVILAAGALLKDNQTGKVLAQLKFQSISPKKIKALTVCIQPLDTVGNPLGDTVAYQYLDLCADRDSEFGQKTPIALPDAATRSFQAFVTEVIFENNTTWTQEIHSWESLKRVQTLSVLQDSELEQQFRLDYGFDCGNLLLEQKELWHCVCGAVNHQDEANCHKCHKSHTDLKAIDMDSLRAKKEERLLNEQKQASIAQAQKDALTKKIIKISSIAAPIIAVVVIAFVIISGSISKNNAYRHAMEQMDAGQYQEAIRIFSELGNYKDSSAQLQIAQVASANEENYQRALALLDSGKYEDAYLLFQELGSYRDSESFLERFHYESVLLFEASTLNGSPSYEVDYEYNSRGLLSKESFTSIDGTYSRYILFDIKGGSGYLTYDYSSDGELTAEHAYYNGEEYHSTVYEYEDNLLKNETQILNFGSRYDHDYYEYEYDDAGNLIHVLWYNNSNHTLYCEQHFEYDEHGQLTSSVSAYDWQTYSSTYENTYDENGQLIRQADTETANVHVYAYDKNGNCVSEDVFVDEVLRYQYFVEYDANNNIINMVYKYLDGAKWGERITTYEYAEILKYEPSL